MLSRTYEEERVMIFKLSQKFNVHVDQVLGFLYHVAAKCAADISDHLAASIV
jgi:hypothetical protein